MVRLHEDDSGICREHRLRHPAVPQRRVPLQSEAPLILRPRQNQVQANLRHTGSLLDRLIKTVYIEFVISRLVVSH